MYVYNLINNYMGLYREVHHIVHHNVNQKVHRNVHHDIRHCGVGSPLAVVFPNLLELAEHPELMDPPEKYK